MTCQRSAIVSCLQPLLTPLTGLEDKAQISMAEIGEPTQDGYAERLMRTLKEEEADLSEYRDYHDDQTSHL